jgi:hypothetical protein
VKSLILICIGAALGIVLLEWLSGCGEVTYLPDRTWHSKECIFLVNEISYGNW